MKKTLLLIFSILIIILSSYKSKKKNENPPGCIKVNENLYFDKTEITNSNWLEYMYWYKCIYGDTSVEYQSILPDTTIWGNGANSALAELYLNHPAYRNDPVLGVSYEQAVAYCKWRSDRVNERIYIQKNNTKITKRKIVKSKGSLIISCPEKYDFDFEEVYRYRLPTKEEWEKMAELDYSEKTKKKMNSKRNKNRYGHNMILCYMNVEEVEFDRNDQAVYQDSDSTSKEIRTMPVASLWPNSAGCYHLIGNVAEMIDEKGIAKGASWRDLLSSIDIKRDYFYDNPTNWVGFRCACDKL